MKVPRHIISTPSRHHFLQNAGIEASERQRKPAAGSRAAAMG